MADKRISKIAHTLLHSLSVFLGVLTYVSLIGACMLTIQNQGIDAYTHATLPTLCDSLLLVALGSWVSSIIYSTFCGYQAKKESETNVTKPTFFEKTKQQLNTTLNQILGKPQWFALATFSGAAAIYKIALPTHRNPDDPLIFGINIQLMKASMNAALLFIFAAFGAQGIGACIGALTKDIKQYIFGESTITSLGTAFPKNNKVCTQATSEATTDTKNDSRHLRSLTKRSSAPLSAHKLKI